MKSNPTSVSYITNSTYFLLFALLGLVYLAGLFVPLMDNDSAHHAGIALRMYLHDDYVNLIDKGKDYLDKPHLLFWLSAFSYSIFGVSTFAFKIPSLLFSILGIYSTYKLGKLLYNKDTGKLAALILASAFAFVLANNDVRMDAILTASVIFATWQLAEVCRGAKLSNVFLGALGLALGFATKGLIGVAVPAIAILIHLLYQRNWKALFNPQWLLTVLFFAILISPVLYCYYLQYDLHPEKIVRGRNNISGIRFILWSQNFERLQGESFSKESNNDYFFFVHTFLWAFLPWSLLSIAAIGKNIRNLFKTPRTTEILTLGSILLLLCLFSISKFKLPHYLNVLFPLFAILTAAYLSDKNTATEKPKTALTIQGVVAIILLLIGLLINLYLFPVRTFWPVLVCAGILIAGVYAWLQNTHVTCRAVILSVTAAAALYFMLNSNFYPQLLTYQAGNEFAHRIKNANIADKDIFYFETGEPSFSFDFYRAYQHENIDLAQLLARKRNKTNTWIFTDEKGKEALKNAGFQAIKFYKQKDYRITQLKPAFLRPDTRAMSCENLYLVELF